MEFKPDPQNPSVGPNMSALAPLFDCFIIVDPPALETIVSLKVNFPSNQFFVKQNENHSALLEKGIDIVVDGDTLPVRLEIVNYLIVLD